VPDAIDAESETLPRTLEALRVGIAEHLHPGAQLFVSLNQETVADVALGEARAGVSMRPDTLVLWLSACKPIAAVAIAQLWERNLLELDDPVARHIPQFAQHGKDRITLRHLLTHTAGIRAVLGKWEDQTWDQIIAAICAARPEPGWEPGKKAGYHPATTWYLLGEIVRRLDGRPYDRYVRDMVFQPIGMNDSWIGLPTDRYRAYGDRISRMHDTTAAQPTANNPHDTEAGAAAVRPASNGRGPIRELGMFYEMLLNRGRPITGQSGAAVISPQSVEALTARHRVGMMDATFRRRIDWGLGFLLNSAHYGDQTTPYGYGRYASPRTFGHSGSRSSTAFADPEHALVVAWHCNGAPDEPRHQQRAKAINEAIYQDLGLT
jgi:CubicO group peptidase (beta-lactamase class C family)